MVNVCARMLFCLGDLGGRWIMRLVILRSACVLFRNLQSRLLELVQCFLRCGLPALMSKPVHHDRQPSFSFLLCEGISEAPLRIVISH